MTTYKAYPAYQDSGVEWLTEIPDEWVLKKFKNLFRIRKRIAGKLGFNILSITQRGIKIKDIKSGDGQLSMDYSKYQVVNEGDFAMNHMDLLTGFVDISNFEGVTSPDYRVFTLEDKLSNSRFFLYILQLCYLEKIFFPLGQGAAHLGRWRLPTEAFHSFEVAVPKIEEQTQIANFLDHETARIDTLIAKQKTLIALLKEKRQAVISHAVTKGLNPDAPMKDSGVEWLGEVPAHWVYTQLKHIAKVKYGIGEPPKYRDEGVALIRATNIRSGRISVNNLALVRPNDIPINRIVWLVEGDIIVVRSGANTGDSSIIPKEYEGCIAGFDMVVTPIKCLSTFLAYAILSNYIRNNQIDIEKMRAAQPHLNAEELGNCFVLLPPMSEQTEIFRYIDHNISKFDNLIKQVETAVGLLKERHTALISAAVTGKIDVRDWVAPDAQFERDAVSV